MGEWPITIVRMGADVDSKGDPIEYDWWHEIPAEKVDALRSHGYEVVEVVPAEPEATAPGPAPSGGTGERSASANDELAGELLRAFDHRAEELLEADAAGEELGGYLLALDEARGRAWAAYTALKRVLNGEPFAVLPERSDGPDVSPPSAGSGLEESATRKDGADLIRAERERQVADEGWTPAHDDKHGTGALWKAAVCYLDRDGKRWPFGYMGDGSGGHGGGGGGWMQGSPKLTPDDRVRELVKAGALVAAEIDRLQRQLPEQSEGSSEAPVAGSGLVALDDVVKALRVYEQRNDSLHPSDFIEREFGPKEDD